MKITVATQNQLPIIKDLAYKIWPFAYGEILSNEQLEYMLKLIYNIDSLKQQLENKHVFLLVEDENQFVGFASYELNYENTNKTKIQKIYILPTIQGKGFGKKIINFIEEKAIDRKQKGLILNVNKYNKAKDFYLSQGFIIFYSEVIDIGKGYIMDDYVMEKVFR